MKKALVTGATGMVGFNIVKSLLKRGHKVTALVRDPAKGKRLLPKECELIQGDICAPETLGPAMADCDWVFHAAGFPEQWMKNNDTFQKINVEGTAHMIDAALNAGVERFILTSTIDVFEGRSGKEYDETIIDPRPKGTYYERSKQDADRLVVEAMTQRGLPAVFLHPSGVFGPGPTESPGTNDLMRKLRDNEIPVLLPGGMPVVYGPDVGEGHVLAAEKAQVGDRFILSDRYFTLEQLSSTVLQAIDPNRKTPTVMPLFVAQTISVIGEFFAKVTGKPPLIPAGQLHFSQWQAIPLNRKARGTLGWMPTPFETALSETLRYLEQ